MPGTPSVYPAAALPATVVTIAGELDTLSERMRFEPVSAMRMFPNASKASCRGELNVAESAGPSVLPDEAVPAIVDTMPLKSMRIRFASDMYKRFVARSMRRPFGL